MLLSFLMFLPFFCSLVLGSRWLLVTRSLPARWLFVSCSLFGSLLSRRKIEKSLASVRVPTVPRLVALNVAKPHFLSWAFAVRYCCCVIPQREWSPSRASPGFRL